MSKRNPVLSLIALLVLVVFQPHAGRAQEAKSDPPAPISIVSLLSQTVSNRATRVQVSGFLVLDFEGEALYLHQEDYRAGLTKNAIRLALTPEQAKQYGALANGYVVITGSFVKRRNSEDIFTGTLFHIEAVRKTLSRHL